MTDLSRTRTNVGVAIGRSYVYRGERHKDSPYTTSSHDVHKSGTYAGPVALVQVLSSTFLRTAYGQPSATNSINPKWESSDEWNEPPTLTLKVTFLGSDGVASDGLGCHLDANLVNT